MGLGTFLYLLLLAVIAVGAYTMHRIGLGGGVVFAVSFVLFLGLILGTGRLRAGAGPRGEA